MSYKCVSSILGLILCTATSASAENIIVNTAQDSVNNAEKGAVVNSGIKLGDEKSGAIQGDGVLKTESRQLEAFERIEVAGASAINIDCSAKKNEISISAEGNIIPVISTKVEGGLLKISIEKPVSATKGISISISSPAALKGCAITGSGTLKIGGLNTNSFQLKNGGTWKIGLSGRCGELKLESTGCTDIDASLLKTEKASVQAKGSGDINLDASSLALDLTGPLKLRCKGKPQIISQKILGGSLETE